MKKSRAEKLLDNYFKGKTSDEDNALVESWFLEETKDKTDKLPEPAYDQLKGKLWAKIQLQQQQKNKARKIRLIWLRLSAAAILLLVGVSIYLSNDRRIQKTSTPDIYTKNDVSPGTNKAILTLSDGTRVALNDVENGKVAVQAGISIIKKNGTLIYEITDQQKSETQQSTALNSIATPKGGKYQVNLPDGTRVWLNSASSLKFPACFKGSKERQVILDGEAYFEVFKDSKRPFKVVSNHQIVQVYGTHFNINSYSDERNTRTTLLEGSVKVSSVIGSNTSIGRKTEQFLKPGQQSVLNNSSPGNMVITEASIEQVMAWKNGYFHFEKDDLYTVMRQLSRWYDVDIVYDVKRSGDEFMGDIPMSANLSEVLKILQFGGIQFKIEGKQIIVTK